MGDEEGKRPEGFRPHLAIDDHMPCHAFTDKLLLLARGERVRSARQLERLSRPDVIFSDEPPARLVEAVVERQRVLGIPLTPVPAPDEGAAPDARLPAAPPEEAFARPERVPFHVELLAARAIRRQAMHQVGELLVQAQAGRSLDLEPVRGTVRQVVASLRRNEQAFASLLRLKSIDSYTYTHSVNTCVLSVILAQRSELAEEAEIVGLGALMHDVGKAFLPQTILKKSGELDALEWELVKQHPTMGMEIVGRAETHPIAMQAVSQHHERLDGSGYPQGLSGADISLPGRIVAIADAYDAMTSDRVYHRAMPVPDAMRWVCEQAGVGFDARLVGTFVRTIGLFPVGSLVRLSTGELAVVASVNPLAISRPTVLIVATSGITANVEPHLLDLSEGARPHAAREIVVVENPAVSGLDIEGYLALVPGLAGREHRGIHGLA